MNTHGTDKVEDTTVPESSKLKKGCKWLLVSHDEVEPDELIKAYNACCEIGDGDSMMSYRDDIYFKMEPCILHVQCRTLTNAKKLIHLATESGFRNSGMVIGKENRITVAIRSAMGLEVPLPPHSFSSGSEVESSSAKMISNEYLKYLTAIANAKMRENWTRSDKLTTLFSDTNWKL